jgi:hypothetical protein
MRESTSQLLRAKIGLVSGSLRRASAALWDDADFGRLYARYLFDLHGIVRASVPVMEAALASARDRSRDDAVAAGLAEYLATHVREELGHDEWLLEDLRVLGFNRDAVLGRIPSASVASLVGAQYYWIGHHHPVAVLGYLAVLEGSPPDAAHIEAVASRTGLPLDSFSTMLKHARLDPYHRDDLDRFIDGLPLTPEHEALIGVSAFHTVHALARVITEVDRRR